MRTKKIISALLILTLIFTLAPYNSNAAGTEDIVVKTLVEPLFDYDWVYPFFGGYAIVQKGGGGFMGLGVSGDTKYGLIDTTGKVVIPVIYDSFVGAMTGVIFNPFRNYIAVASKDGKDYYFAKTDNEIITLDYGYIAALDEEICAAQKNGKWGLTDVSGKEITPFIYDNIDLHLIDIGLIKTQKDGKWGLIDKKGKVIVSFIYDDIYFNDGDLIHVKKDSKYGFIDKTGKIVVPLIYNDIIHFNDNGLAYAEKDGKFGYIDKAGKEIVPVIYDGIEESANFTEGLVCALKNKKMGFVDKTGREVIPFVYDWVSFYRGEKPAYTSYYSFSEGLAAVRKDGKWGYIDKTGKTVLPFIYDIANSFDGGSAIVSKDGKYGLIDKTGKALLPFEYYLISSFNQDGLAEAQKDGRRSFVDKTGKTVIGPYAYNNVYDFKDGVALVGKGVKYGLVDKTGKELAPPVYDQIYDLSDGMVGVVKDGKLGYIDNTGKEAVPCIYDATYYTNSDFTDGLALVFKDGKCGYIDKTGKVVVPLIYSYAYEFKEGLSMVYNTLPDGSQKYGVIDKTGKIIVPVIYENVSYPQRETWDNDSVSVFKEGLINVKKDGKWGILQILKVGYPIGAVLYSDITAYINGYAIPTSVINGKTLVAAEDLAKYGFDVVWNNGDRSLRIELNKNKKFNPIPTIKDTLHKPGTFKCNYLFTDIKTYLSGEVVESYAINGVTLIDFELLKKYGKLTWDSKAREIRLVIG